MIQKRFEVDYIFYLEDTPLSKTVSMRCPHCGGPITRTGQKVCEFCDSKLIDTIKRTWKFNSIKEF